MVGRAFPRLEDVHRVALRLRKRARAVDFPAGHLTLKLSAHLACDLGNDDVSLTELLFDVPNKSTFGTVSRRRIVETTPYMPKQPATVTVAASRRPDVGGFCGPRCSPKVRGERKKVGTDSTDWMAASVVAAHPVVPTWIRASHKKSDGAVPGALDTMPIGAELDVLRPAGKAL